MTHFDKHPSLFFPQIFKSRSARIARMAFVVFILILTEYIAAMFRSAFLSFSLFLSLTRLDAIFGTSTTRGRISSLARREKI